MIRYDHKRIIAPAPKFHSTVNYYLTMISIPLLEIRTLDVCLLLSLGFLLECVCRGLVLAVRWPSMRVYGRYQDEQHRLQFETAQARRLGPSAFVTTSKLERQLLQHEKTMEEYHQRQCIKQTARFQSLARTIQYAVYVLIFIFYYKVDVISLDGTRVFPDSSSIVSSSQSQRILTWEESNKLAAQWVQGFLFPISYVGIGMKVARWGLPTPGFGALLVFWSAQVTTGALIWDTLECLVLAML
jgi:hypothetical protein